MALRWLVVVAALVTSACGAGLPVSSAHPGTVPATPAPPAGCQAPVVTLGHEKGNTPGGGFLSLPDGTYRTDPTSGLAYDARFRRWLPVEPELVAPDEASYALPDPSGGIAVVDVASGQRRLLLAAGAGPGRWTPRRFAAEGIYVNRASGLSLLTLDGRLTPVADAGRYWDLIAPTAAWASTGSDDPTLYRLDLKDRSVTAWYHPPPGTRRRFVPGVDTAGSPFLMFQGDPGTPWRMGLVTGRDTLLELTPPPEVRSATGFGVGLTDDRGLWLGMYDVGLLLVAPDHSFKLVSSVPANIVRLAGACARLDSAEVVPPPTAPPATVPPATVAPSRPTPSAPPQRPPPTPAEYTVAVPMHLQQHALSCEEAALSMVLAFYRHPTTEQQVFDQVGIDTVHSWAGRAGGGDPYVDFVGSPDGSEVQQTGYGVYWPPIRTAATRFGAPVAQAGEGVAPAAIYAAARAGHPALVWVTYDLRPHPRADYQAYDGRTIPYAGAYEHVMVVTGLSAAGVRVNDPAAGQYWVPFAQFEAAYAVYNQMAVVFG